MGIKELKEKASKSTLLTGAAKIATTTTLIAALIVGAPTVAHADVPASNIVGDAETWEDRSDIKVQDGVDIRDYFEGYNRYGESYVTEDEVRKAIELSNALNAYYLDPLYYTNTTKDEVLSLDIDSLYANYTNAVNNNYSNSFCNNNLTNKPAIDAYTLFACGTLSRNLKTSLASNIYSIISSEYGYNVSYPTIIVNSNEVYAIFTINGTVQKVNLYGDLVDSIKNSCVALDTRYNTGLNNLSGYSSNYENSFAYNGVDRYTDESVWLSFPDDERKANLTDALNLSGIMANSDNYEVSIDAYNSATSLSDTEKQELRNMGYSKDALRYATHRNAYLNTVPKFQFK